MISIEETKLNNDFVLKVKNIKKELHNIVFEINDALGQGGNVSNNLVLYVKELSCELSEHEYNYENMFVNGIISRIPSNIRFEKMPIYSSFESFKEPLLLISDENEIDSITSAKLSQRRNSGLDTFPVIIFGDDFFSRREGESFGYLPIIESLEDSIAEDCHSMALKMSDVLDNIEYIYIYLDYLYMMVTIYSYANRINVAKDYIERIIKYIVSKDINNNSALAQILLNNKVKSYINKLNILVDYERILAQKKHDVESIIVDLRNEYDKRILLLRNKEVLKNASPMAVHLDLKYGDIKSQINSFLSKVKRSNVIEFKEFYVNDIDEIIDKTKNENDSNASEMTLVGTFSSGKTTLINTFLGHEHKLHTSKNHNTAVLTKIKKNKLEYEYYEIFYKDKLVWDIVKPAYMNTQMFNPFDEKTRVVRIGEEDSNYVVRLRLLSDKNQKLTMRINKSHKLAIAENDIIEGKAPLTKNNYISQGYQLTTKSEVKYLLKAIKNNKIINSKIHILSRDNEKIISGDKVLKTLERISMLENYKNVSSETRRPSISVESIYNMFGDILYVRFIGDIKMSNETRKLDNKGWLEFCGKEEKGKLKSDKLPFCEMPDCYMVSDYIEVNLNSDFLNYCSLNDTPGFGSITEEHDACTERFINNNNSRLLVLIQIYSKTEDVKLYDFLNYISNVYHNYRSHQIDNVYFMLNCFSNNAEPKKLESDVKKIVKYLKHLGFNINNVYVCNLRESTEDSKEMNEMFGFPSYILFKEDCIEKMLEIELKKKYKGIFDTWNSFFDTNIKNADNQIKKLKEDYKDSKNNVLKIQKKIEKVNNIQEPSAEQIFQDAKKQYDYIYDSIEKTFLNTNKKRITLKKDEAKEKAGYKKIVFLHTYRERLSEINTIIESLKNDVIDYRLKEYSDDIGKDLESSLLEIGVISGKKIGEELDDKEAGILFTVSIERIKQILNKADEESNLFDKIFNENKNIVNGLSDIKEILVKDYETSHKNAQVYFDKLLKKYRFIKKNVINELERELDALENPDEKKKQIDVYSSIMEELDKYKKILKDKVDLGFLGV